ncbi:MAG: bifunctional hydroxymethylpyrimidine kinase/phosphomethylpyrimidine kinase [Proteobacteria bacterium]|nr:bifunctional hydroxymethylpyrimidine kinase/phosphomethylpyrimidine kinase [Pseudomonadota bacterium]MBU1650148.1 bifunctional hydroxymethylpyrimidine kinase/phosphomethylpyrimidine kinase [Pseudomonadota bacterium]MBU1986655.1 bifunctional hydroxymethylpyrimidine kinase/phosphomethylpyrimidine kinase [Pseudomonadota bacterium]
MYCSQPTLSPTVLTIAGSDPSGGAGIQADLKTMTSIGVYGAAAITCITIQNSLGVMESVPLESGLVVRQVQAVLVDHHVTHIKIGMIGTMEIARALGKLLADYSGEVVYDPVLASTTGHSLLSYSSLSELSTYLISKVTVLTPNCSELEQLCQQKITTPEEALRCAGTILARDEHLRAVIVKGGHLEPDRTDIHDYLIMKNLEIVVSKRRRIQSANLHGTGCTYASAFAAFHSREKDYRKAFFLTAAYMDSIISKSSSISLVKSGVNGPLVHAL